MIGSRRGRGFRRDILRRQEAEDGVGGNDRRLRQHRTATRRGRGSQVHHAGETALGVNGSGPGKTEPWRRLDALAAAAGSNTRHRRGAGLRERIGDAEKRQNITLAAVAPKRDRDEIAGAVET